MEHVVLYLTRLAEMTLLGDSYERDKQWGNN